MRSITFTTEDARWKAVIENDSTADGVFLYGVVSTGVYCNPSCASKKPNQQNIVYFMTCEEAESAGYRACKRCKPNDTSKVSETKQKIIRACRIIEKCEHQLKLHELAARVNLSPYYFHRIFKKIVGVTPKQYASRYQALRYQNNLKTSPSITDAIYSAGFCSSGSAYDKKKDQLAMKPTTYRQGAAGMTIVYGITECFLGWVIVAATHRGICAIELGDDPVKLKNIVQRRFPNAQFNKADVGFNVLIEKVVDFIKSPANTFDVPLDIQGTSFQQQVWQVLREIKPGETISYTDVAELIGKPGAFRAVASACAANRLAVVIPCHRVLTKEGSITGYRWGKDRKKRLLDSEKTRL